MRNLFQDLAYATRQLRHAPGFTTVAVFKLGAWHRCQHGNLHPGARHHVAPLPVKDPGSLYRIGTKEAACCMTGGLQGEWDLYSTDLYKQFERQTPEFEQLAAFEARTTVSAFAALARLDRHAPCAPSS